MSVLQTMEAVPRPAPTLLDPSGVAVTQGTHLPLMVEVAMVGSVDHNTKKGLFKYSLSLLQK